MGSTTAKGYPYPVGTDRVMDGDNAIQSLAEAADTKAGVVAAGTFSVVATSVLSASTAVTFPAGRFTVAPVVVTSILSTTSVWQTGGVASITPTGFTGFLCRSDPASTGTATLTLGYIAREPG
jgi:hypothetical protein